MLSTCICCCFSVTHTDARTHTRTHTHTEGFTNGSNKQLGTRRIPQSPAMPLLQQKDTGALHSLYMTGCHTLSYYMAVSRKCCFLFLCSPSSPPLVIREAPEAPKSSPRSHSGRHADSFSRRPRKHPTQEKNKSTTEVPNQGEKQTNQGITQTERKTHEEVRTNHMHLVNWAEMNSLGMRVEGLDNRSEMNSLDSIFCTKQLIVRFF